MALPAEHIVSGLTILAFVLAFMGGVMSAYINVRDPAPVRSIREFQKAFDTARFDFAHLFGFGILLGSALYAVQVRDSVITLHELPKSVWLFPYILTFGMLSGGVLGRLCRYSRLGLNG